MTTSPQSAFILTGLYVAVHVINALVADVAISAALIRGSQDQIAVAPRVRRDDVVRLDASWFSGRRCTRPTRDVTLRLGTTILHLPRDEVGEMTLDSAIVREENGSGVIRIAGTAGCPENPLVGQAVKLVGPGRHVDGVTLWSSPTEPGEISGVGRRLAGTRRLAECEAVGTLRSCPVDNDRVRILFGDPLQPMASGLPLHAVCTASDGGTACEITETQTGGVSYRAFLRRAADSADLIAAEGEVRARLADYARAEIAPHVGAGL